MDLCANFLVFLLGYLVLQCLNHILMTDSLLHMKRSALSCYEKRTREEQDPPRINKTNWIHIIWYFRDCIQYHDIHTVYIAYTWYHNPYTTCTQNVHSLNRSLQFINTSAPGLLRWVPGQEQQGLHFMQKSWLRLLVKRWLILTKQITCNLHPPDLNSAYNKENSLVLLTVQESGVCNCTCSNW